MIKFDMSKVKKEIEEFNDKIDNLNVEVAEVVSGIVIEEFEIMLNNAPQYSGNFVANMWIRSGRAGGARKQPKKFFEKPSSVQQAVERGSQAAIEVAKSENSGIRDELVSGVQTKTGWFGGAVVYNRLSEGDIIEGLGVSELRSVNSSGAHPIAKMDVAVQARFDRLALVGSPEWERLRKVKGF
jgi:hypothetical protein